MKVVIMPSQAFPPVPYRTLDGMVRGHGGRRISAEAGGAVATGEQFFSTTVAPTAKFLRLGAAPSR